MLKTAAENISTQNRLLARVEKRKYIYMLLLSIAITGRTKKNKEYGRVRCESTHKISQV